MANLDQHKQGAIIMANLDQHKQDLSKTRQNHPQKAQINTPRR